MRINNKPNTRVVQICTLIALSAYFFLCLKLTVWTYLKVTEPQTQETAHCYRDRFGHKSPACRP